MRQFGRLTVVRQRVIVDSQRGAYFSEWATEVLVVAGPFAPAVYNRFAPFGDGCFISGVYVWDTGRQPLPRSALGDAANLLIEY